jgi:antitoxin component YwqK of YwqJK toxin-antitoxin module
MKVSYLFLSLYCLFISGVMAQSFSSDSLCSPEAKLIYNQFSGKLESCGCFDSIGRRVGKWVYFNPKDAGLNTTYFDERGNDSLSIFISKNHELKLETVYMNGKPRLFIQKRNEVIVSIVENIDENMQKSIEFFYPSGKIKSISTFIPGLHAVQICDYSINFSESGAIEKYKIFIEPVANPKDW